MLPPPRLLRLRCGAWLFWLGLLAAALGLAWGLVSAYGLPATPYLRATVMFVALSISTVGVCMGFAALDRLLRRRGISIGRFIRHAEDANRQWQEMREDRARAEQSADLLDQATPEAPSTAPRRRL